MGGGGVMRAGAEIVEDDVLCFLRCGCIRGGVDEETEGGTMGKRKMATITRLQTDTQSYFSMCQEMTPLSPLLHTKHRHTCSRLCASSMASRTQQSASSLACASPANESCNAAYSGGGVNG